MVRGSRSALLVEGADALEVAALQGMNGRGVAVTSDGLSRKLGPPRAVDTRRR